MLFLPDVYIFNFWRVFTWRSVKKAALPTYSLVVQLRLPVPGWEIAGNLGVDKICRVLNPELATLLLPQQKVHGI